MNVTFEESPFSATTATHAQSGKLIGFLLRHHVVKTVSQAQALLLLLALTIFIVSGLLARTNFKDATIDTRKNFVPAIPER
jgi:hypothetical protein